MLITKYSRSRLHYQLVAVSLFLMLFAICTPGGAAPVQPQDHLQEKLDFLKAKLERYLTHSLGTKEATEAGNISFEAVSFESCEITWEIATDSGHSAELPLPLRDIKLKNQVSVNLSSIDAAQTKIYVVESMRQHNIPWSLFVELRVRRGASGFRQELVTTKRGRVTTLATEEKSFSFSFDTRDQRVAEDVANAFAEASNICRSRMQRRR